MPLENFDAVGLWRTEVRGELPAKSNAKSKKGESRPAAIAERTPVDSSAVLPNGTKVAGIDDLKRVLGETRREQFARAIVRRLMSYSLGRSLDFGDEPSVDLLAERFQANDLRLRPLVEDIVLSDRFRNK